MLPALAATLASLVTATFASHPSWAGSPKLWLALLLAELPLALWALVDLWRRAALDARLRPRFGDLTLGVTGAVALIIAVWAGRTLLSPPGSPQQAWLMRLYLQLGAPGALERVLWVPMAVIAVAVLDELVWRGWVQYRLGLDFGLWRSALLTGLLFGVQSLPTMVTLADPAVGFNPLLVPAAFAGGLLWSYLTVLRGSAVAAMISHAAFTYFTVMQFRPG